MLQRHNEVIQAIVVSSNGSQVSSSSENRFQWVRYIKRSLFVCNIQRDICNFIKYFNNMSKLISTDIHMHTGRQVDKQAWRYQTRTDRQAYYRQAGKRAGRQSYRQADSHIGRQTAIQAGRQSYRQADRQQPYRQADRQTQRKTRRTSLTNIHSLSMTCLFHCLTSS